MDEMATYRIELEQVAAALALDPTNAELIELKSNLEEVIALSSQFAAPKPAKAGKATETKGRWAVGDLCEAVWASDGGYYKAKIETIDGQNCTVKFIDYDDVDTVQMGSLRTLDASKKRKVEASEATGGGVVKEEKTQAEKDAERERKKRKRERKEKRLEEKTQEATAVANSWQKFNSGRSTKSKTGFLSGKKKESIFKSPDSVTGKVGVGTCNIGGKGMTDFIKRDKWTYNDN